MTVDDYQREAYKTCNPDLTHEQRMGNWIAGLAGETAELFEVAEQALTQPLLYSKIDKELGDSCWYGAALATQCRLALSAVLDHQLFDIYQMWVVAGDTELKSLDEGGAMFSGLNPLLRGPKTQKIYVRCGRVSKSAGLLCDYLKKVLYHKHELDVRRVAAGLQEYFRNIALVVAEVHPRPGIDGPDLATITVANIEKLRQRYTGGRFSTAESIARRDVQAH